MSTSHDTYEVFAIKYAERNTRTRADSFLFDDDHAAPHPMDYFVWVIRNDERLILVDTGYDEAEGARRDRRIIAHPVQQLARMGIDADTVTDIIITHLHYDHAGTLNSFPKARFFLQDSDMAFATGRCMCDQALNHPFTVDHICQMVKHVYSGRVTFIDGDDILFPGISVHKLGGHSPGLQAVRVKTGSGHLVLASDASHFYENVHKRKLFPIVVDAPAMLKGFDRLHQLASRPDLIIPGHDPLVRERHPALSPDQTGHIHRLDRLL